MTGDYRKDGIPKKTAAAKILNAYSGGEPYIEGVQWTAFGRAPEVEEFDQTLKLTKDGAGTMKLYVGPYGVGKSFVLALFQSLAIKKGYVVMTATIDPKSKYFAGSNQDKQGLALYRSFIESTAIKGQTKNAFGTILENWYEELKNYTHDSGLGAIYNVLDCKTFMFNSISAYSDVREAIRTRFRELDAESYDSKAMEYFLAKYTKKADVSRDIGAKDYITENNWFDILNALSHFFVAAGYSGLIVMVDQVDFLITLPKLSRQQNYQKILSMWNNINQGRTEYLSFIMFGSDQILINKKGFQEEIPLFDRTKDSYIIKPLPQGELVGLLTKLQQIHELVYDWKSGFTESQIKDFIEQFLSGSPMNNNCVRPISKAWVTRLNECQRNPNPNNTIDIDEEDIKEVQEEMGRTDEDILKALRDDD